jgi:hypothetical protein
MLKQIISIIIISLFCLIHNVEAQKAKPALTDKQAEKLIIKEPAKAYKLAKQNKLTYTQIQFFISYEMQNERNFQYTDTLCQLHWAQLGHKDKLIYNNLIFADNIDFNFVSENGNYTFNKAFSFVLDNQEEVKKMWGDSLYNDYITQKLNVGCHEIGAYSSEEKIYTTAEKEQNVELYLMQIKQRLPKYESQTRASIYSRCVYDFTTDKEKHYFWLNDYLTKYETKSQEFFSAVISATFDVSNLIHYQYALNWVEKAIKIDDKVEFHIAKAELLYQIGKIENNSTKINEAKTLITTCLTKISPNNDFEIKYSERVKDKIYNNK